MRDERQERFSYQVSRAYKCKILKFGFSYWIKSPLVGVRHRPEQNRVTWKTPSSEAFVPLQEPVGVLASYVPYVEKSLLLLKLRRIENSLLLLKK